MYNLFRIPFLVFVMLSAWIAQVLALGGEAQQEKVAGASRGLNQSLIESGGIYTVGIVLLVAVIVIAAAYIMQRRMVKAQLKAYHHSHRHLNKMLAGYSKKSKK